MAGPTPSGSTIDAPPSSRSRARRCSRAPAPRTPRADADRWRRHPGSSSVAMPPDSDPQAATGSRAALRSRVRAPGGALGGVADLDAGRDQPVPDQVRGREVLVLPGARPHRQQRLDERRDRVGRVGGALLGQLAEPDHQRPQHPAGLVGVVALQGVGLPGGDRLLQPEYGGHAAVDVAAAQRGLERLPGPVRLGPQRRRRGVGRRRPVPQSPPAAPAPATADCSPRSIADSASRLERLAGREGAGVAPAADADHAVAGHRHRPGLDVDEHRGVLVDTEHADVVGQLGLEQPSAAPRRGSRTGCRGSRPPCCRSAARRPPRRR